MTGLRRARVAELIVTTPDGRQRGSGYRVTTDAVLTAAHVLQNAESVVVRFEPDLPGEWTVQAESWWSGSSDLAVVTISGEQVEPVLFGRVGDRAAVIPVQAVGFPLWKFRSDFRDAFHATGTVAVLSNWRSGTLEFSLSPPPDAPWNGMSGAALWAGDRIVGVVTAHHPDDGPARLTATRIDQPLLDRLGVQVWPDVVRDAPADRVLSAYREQLFETAPSMLLDRAGEIDELVRFCAGDSPYLWLQAGPWAGKSALLSSFVLHYLPRGVDVVSFFVISRFAGQSDSDAFTESMIEQLAALVDEPAAPLLQSRARRGHMATLLREAAQRSVEAGRRLLMVVDGLDEDTGRSSIARLLPADPPPGVRVLVASRPHPGLPDDVPPDHPLRTLTPSPLTGSPHARDIARRAKDELRAALTGSDHERRVLGLITASGWGLTRDDIEEVTGWAPYELDQVLEGGLARSLTYRASSTLYVFSHETLREMAYQQLGSTLNGYRGQLHDWAARYQGWPANTPVYLMRGYPRMLATTGDLPRLLALAVDRDRHERLLEYSGGDALAQIEIANATDLAAREQDIGALLLLAVLRDELVDRNSRIPHDLPAVWVKLGEPTRALALAQGVAIHEVRANALVAMAEAAYGDDRYRVDRRILDKIERETRKLTDANLRDSTIGLLAAAAARGGWHEDAARLAAAVGHPDQKLTAETAGAIALKDLDHAARLAAQIGYYKRRAQALMDVLQAAVSRPDPDLARRLADAVRVAIFDTDKEWDIPVRLLVRLAAVVGGMGDHAGRDELIKAARDRGIIIEVSVLVRGAMTEGRSGTARAFIESAEEKVLRALERFGPHGRHEHAFGLWLDMADLAKAMVMVGDFDRAELLIMKIVSPAIRDWALAGHVGALAAAGEHDSAQRVAVAIASLANRAQAMTWVAGARQGEDSRRLIGAAERYARQAADSWQRGAVLADLVRPVAAAGSQDCARRLAEAAERLAHRVRSGTKKAHALCAVVEVVDLVLGREHARRVAALALAEARSSDYHDVRTAELEVIGSLARIGDIHMAEQIALEHEDRVQRLRSLATAAKAGDFVAAQRFAAVAKQQYQRRDPDSHWSLTHPLLVEALLAIGAYAQANEFAGLEQAKVLASEAIARATEGDLDRARELAAEALRELQSEDPPLSQEFVAEALAAAGDFDAAVALAPEADETDRTFPGRRAVAVRLAAAGDLARAEELVAEMDVESARSRALVEMATVVPEEEARRLVSEVLTSETWQQAVAPAARLIGPKVVGIAEYLLD